ncbi:hypothetical protein [Streptomyces sp. YIM S03343]
MAVPLEVLATSADGVRVHYAPVGSHAATHFADTPQLAALTREALARLTVSDGPTVVSVMFDRVVGEQDLVPTDATDDIVYARRLNRDTYSRFTRSRRPVPSHTVSLVLGTSGGVVLLASSWIGPASPPFPGDPYETPDSRPYWYRHALAWGRQEVDVGSITQECPWD